MSLLQLDPPIPVMTPRGKALAVVLIDYGVEFDLMWTCFLDSGECWTFRNPEIRAQTNETIGRKATDGNNSRGNEAPAVANRLIERGVLPRPKE
jgi:hypothetical protein